MTKLILSDERVTEIAETCYVENPDHYCEPSIKKALAEAEPIIRKNERDKIASWLEHSNEIHTKQEAAEQLRDRE